jgi:tetratricopeptide (TPR) repeat protein
VKLRPSYFEAVEHLIGLLCGDHRASEAVGIIDFVERSLRLSSPEEDRESDTSSEGDRSSSSSAYTVSDFPAFDFELRTSNQTFPEARYEDISKQPGFGSSGYAIAGPENGRMLALVHAKGNMLYALGDITGASRAFEDAVLISAGRRVQGIRGLISKIREVLSSIEGGNLAGRRSSTVSAAEILPVLLPPEKALRTAALVFSKHGQLPGLRYVPHGMARTSAISTTSNSLLSLAKIFQDGMTTGSLRATPRPSGTGDILALYYLSLSLQPSPSTANNVGILLAGMPPPVTFDQDASFRNNEAFPSIPGVKPGSGIALALAYYNYGLNLDSRHAHLYTNLGSLLKDIGQLAAAIKMYEQAVSCDGNFDIALANLANAVKDQGRIGEAIEYYKRAVASSPDFAEAVCGLANARNSVCDWTGRGGVIFEDGRYDRWHVDEDGMLNDAKVNGTGSGWMKRVVTIVGKQLDDGANWGRGTLNGPLLQQIVHELEVADSGSRWHFEKAASIQARLSLCAGKPWEGARLVRLIERGAKRATYRWYHDKYIKKLDLPPASYPRPQIPSVLSVPGAPTVLPFHTFTCPLSAKDIRMISQRNALRISCATLRAPWLPNVVYPPPPPPSPHLNIGYVSSDFNNHPLAHLMQSVFGMHNHCKVRAFCYATTPSDNSVHRRQIEREAPIFRDTSSWSSDKLVQQIVQDQIHILVNLNGYTRGAKNEVFAARPAPIHMSFMGFAGTLGAEWCDYLLADEIAVPPQTLRPWRRNVDLEDQQCADQATDEEDWVYSENIIFCRDTFFCCDHRQSSQDAQISWPDEQLRRWKMRKDLFPDLPDDTIILGNFNQLYKVKYL